MLEHRRWTQRLYSSWRFCSEENEKAAEICSDGSLPSDYLHVRCKTVSDHEQCEVVKCTVDEVLEQPSAYVENTVSCDRVDAAQSILNGDMLYHCMVRLQIILFFRCVRPIMFGTGRIVQGSSVWKMISSVKRIIDQTIIL